MNRIFMIAMALVAVSTAGVAIGQDPGIGYPQNSDPWNAVPRPSGLRFGAIGETTVLTGDDGGGGVVKGADDGPGPCCGNNGGQYPYCWTGCSGPKCIHWTQFTWYASWGHDCGDNCTKQPKHEWLH